MAAPSVLVGRMIETIGRLRSRNGHGSGMIRFVFEEFAAVRKIRKRHRHTSHRIDGSQRRRITRLVRPGLKMHGLGGADADQDSQDFRHGSPSVPARGTGCCHLVQWLESGKPAVFAIACRKLGSVVSASVLGIAVCWFTPKVGTACGKTWFGSRSGLWLSSR